MTKTILLVVRTPQVARNVIDRVQVEGVRLIDAHSGEDIDAAFAAGPVDHVIFGGGIDLDDRLALVRRVFEASDATTVHLNSPTGPDTYLPFVRAVLGALVDL